MAYVEVAARVLLAGVFVLSLGGKARGRAAFIASVRALWTGPGRWVPVVAAATVVSEAAVVVLLAVPAAGVAGLLAAAGILAVFTAAILSAVRRGQRAPCRCFGASATPLGAAHVVRNAGLLAACALGLAAALTDPPAPRPAGVALALASAAVCLLLVLRFDDLAAVLAPRTGGTVQGR